MANWPKSVSGRCETLRERAAREVTAIETAARRRAPYKIAKRERASFQRSPQSAPASCGPACAGPVDCHADTSSHLRTRRRKARSTVALGAPRAHAARVLAARE